MLKLYTYFRSSAAYRVRVALELKGLSYESCPIHLLRGGGEQHGSDFAALNPQELVPVLLDDGQVLTQSLPIIEYLEERYPQRALLPDGLGGRARVRSIAQAIACEIHPLNNLRVLQQLELGLGLDAAARSGWYAHWLTQGFTALERMLAKSTETGDFCHGDQPTLADCCLVPQVYNARRFEVPLVEFPTLCRIADHCMQLSAFQRAAPEQQPDAV
jgi:maleylacetoacetate isomerase